MLNFWGRINWEMFCIGLDKWWLLCAGCYGAPFLWLGAYGLSCKFMLTHISFAYWSLINLLVVWNMLIVFSSYRIIVLCFCELCNMVVVEDPLKVGRGGHRVWWIGRLLDRRIFVGYKNSRRRLELRMPNGLWFWEYCHHQRPFKYLEGNSVLFNWISLSLRTENQMEIIAIGILTLHLSK